MTDTAFYYEDTICAPATPAGGAISVIRISGKRAVEIADSLFKQKVGKSLAQRAAGTVAFGDILDEEGETLDEVLVTLFRAPHSYTGEDSVEISCHGSAYIASRLLQSLIAKGCRMARPGEFTQRAFLNGKMDLSRAEAVAALIASTSAASHRVALKQMRGQFSEELAALRDKLLHLTTLLELELDFSDHEDLEFADRTQLQDITEEIRAKLSRLASSFRLGNAIKNGIPVAIAGATNTGKSTLLNALLGEDRAIVSDVHGTTRDTIEETLNIDGVLFRFIDTAGLRETDEVVEQIGIQRTFKKISEASIILGMIDLTRDFESTRETIRSIIEKVDFSCQKLIFLLNKTDISDVRANTDTTDFIISELENKGVARTNTAIIPISAKTGSGVGNLRTHLADSQRDLLADSDTTLVTNQRHIQALTDAHTSLLRVRSGLAAGLPTDLAAQDIREAIYHLGSIVGEISSDEVLGNIFRNFCIGK